MTKMQKKLFKIIYKKYVYIYIYIYIYIHIFSIIMIIENNYRW